jgi:hypothetical protein
MKSAARVLVTLALLVFSAGCTGPKLELDRGYLLDHDGQQLTATVTTTLPPNSSVFEPNESVQSNVVRGLRNRAAEEYEQITSFNPRYFLVVRNNGKKGLSIIASVARGVEVQPSGDVVLHMWIRFFDLPPSTDRQSSEASTDLTKKIYFDPPKHTVIDDRWLQSFELGSNEEKEFELGRLGFQPGTQTVRLHLDWESVAF